MVNYNKTNFRKDLLYIYTNDLNDYITYCKNKNIMRQ